MSPEEKVSVVVLFPFLLEAKDDAYHRWSPLTMSRSYSEGSQRNTLLYSWLLREIIIKDIAEYETNKKIIPKKQGLKANVGSLKSDEERKLVAQTMMEAIPELNQTYLEEIINTKRNKK